MKILDVVCSAGRTGFYFDDQRAIKKGAGHDGVFYTGEPVTEGFASVRQAGESISVMLVLEDGQIAYGDCAAVQYSGAGGRDPLFLAKDFIPLIDKYIKPELVGQEADSFRALAKKLEDIQIDGKRLHTAIRYGVSQALLDAVAKASGRLMCEVVADEYGCEVTDQPIAIFTQSGDDRYDNADKMIIKGAQVLPHALINNVETKLGQKGEKLAAYVEWLRNRILDHRNDEAYSPVLHIDCYGTIGAIFGNNNYKAMADYIARLGEIAKPFHLRIEGPKRRLRRWRGLRRSWTTAESTWSWWRTSGATRWRTSSCSPTRRPVTWCRSKRPTSAASTTRSKRFCIASRRASARIRAARATKPTAARRCACIAPWRRGPCRFSPSPAWAWTRAS